MSTYHCKESYLRPYFKHSIIERDDKGAPVGAYIGYYNHRSHIVTLYPNYKHPLSRYRTLFKKKISDLEVRCEGTSNKAQSTESRVQNVKSQTSEAMHDVCKQIRMKF